jgi:hypothetical protein
MSPKSARTRRGEDRTRSRSDDVIRADKQHARPTADGDCCNQRLEKPRSAGSALIRLAYRNDLGGVDAIGGSGVPELRVRSDGGARCSSSRRVPTAARRGCRSRTPHRSRGGSPSQSVAHHAQFRALRIPPRAVLRLRVPFRAAAGAPDSVGLSRIACENARAPEFQTRNLRGGDDGRGLCLRNLDGEDRRGG